MGDGASSYGGVAEVDVSVKKVTDQSIFGKSAVMELDKKPVILR